MPDVTAAAARHRPPRPCRGPAPRGPAPPVAGQAGRAGNLRRRGQRNPHRLHRHRRRHHRPDDRQVQLRVEDRRLHPRPGPAPGRHLAGRRPVGQAAAGDDHRARLRRFAGPGRRGRAGALRARSAAEPRVAGAARQLDEPPLRPPGPGLSCRTPATTWPSRSRTPIPGWSIRWSSSRCNGPSTSSAARATTTPSRS